MGISALKTKIIGKRILLVEEVGSTNDEAKKLAARGESEGTVVVASSQNRGRGRLDRRWISPPGGLYLSVILKPYISPSMRPLITLFTSVALLRTIKGLTKLPATLKWPNDAVIAGKKVGGILCEGVKNAVIVGIGINLNTNLGLFPKSLKKQVTSLKFECGAEVSRDKLLKILLEEFDKLYKVFLERRFGEIISEWSSSCSTLGSMVRVETAKGEIKGIAESLGNKGELRVRCSDGKIKKVISAEAVKLNEGEE